MPPGLRIIKRSSDPGFPLFLGRNRSAVSSRILISVIWLVAAGALLATDGDLMHGAGPINESMGGAGTGSCLDATGSIAWNPACTTRFTGNTLEGAFEYFIPSRTLSSSVAAGAFAAGFPAQSLFGATKSATNPGMMPSLAFIRRRAGSRNSFHIGLISVAGFGVDYPQDSSYRNAILTAQPPNGMGFGAIDSNYALMRMPIGISRSLTDRLSLGISAVPAFSMLKVAPAPFAAPVSTDGGRSAQYLSASKTASAAGIGADVGLHYQASRVLAFGASYHSPVHFASMQWTTSDAAGSSHNIGFRLDMPALVTMGVGITPASGTQLALDARWIDYANTEGFKASGFRADGSVAGFGWRNIWTVGGGVQQRVSRKIDIRLGYNYSQNPIPPALSFFNTPAPAIVQHHLTAGITRTLSPKLAMHLVFYHVFRNQETGPFVGPQGAIPGASVTSQLAENSIAIGFTRGLSRTER